MQERIKKLQAVLEDDNLDFCLILQNKDMFYFSGTMQDGVLIVPRDVEPALLIRRNYERGVEETRIKNVVRMKSLKEVKDVVKGFVVKKDNQYEIGIEEDVLPISLYKRLLNMFPGAIFRDISLSIRRIRMTKDVNEVELLKRSAEVNDAVHRRVKEVLCEGITELELYAELEREGRRLGDDRMGLSRGFNSLSPNQLGSGKNGLIPNRAFISLGGVGLSPVSPCGPSDKKIVKGEPVFVDWVISFEGYITDQARIYSVGRLDEDLLRAYDTCKEIYDAIISSAKVGRPAKELYNLAIKMAGERGYEDRFLGLGDYRVKFVGHGVGLELDELPVISHREETALQENMVIAIEPKILTEKGGVGIENTLLITKDGAVPLTKAEEGMD